MISLHINMWKATFYGMKVTLHDPHLYEINFTYDDNSSTYLFKCPGDIVGSSLVSYENYDVSIRGLTHYIEDYQYNDLKYAHIIKVNCTMKMTIYIEKGKMYAVLHNV